MSAVYAQLASINSTLVRFEGRVSSAESTLAGLNLTLNGLNARLNGVEDRQWKWHGRVQPERSVID